MFGSKRVQAVAAVLAVVALVYALRGDETATTGPFDHRELVEEARMTESAYYNVRTVAALQLGYIVLFFEKEAESDRLRPSFQRMVCPARENDPGRLVAWEAEQKAKLHSQILTLRAFADLDGSDTVSDTEGAAFRDLVEFGYLASHVADTAGRGPSFVAAASGLDPNDAYDRLNTYCGLLEAYAGTGRLPLPDACCPE